MKSLLYLILLTIILGLGYLKFAPPSQLSESAPVASANPSSASSPVFLPTRPLKTAFFTLEYPTNATASAVVETPDALTWSVYYWGPTQKAQTELYDGYAITLTRFETAGENVAQTQADSDRQTSIDVCGEEVVTPVTTAVIADQSALTFSGGCLGEASPYYFTVQDILYRLTIMVTGTPEQTSIYQQAVDSILASLTFL
ncbi:MAG: hypothetical protein UX59_C0031G0014 [Microgenomates group bacterium GW2011_GWA1_46_7]|nr:MAG: hypothetical protein UX59_C0031G0014 [Microgenomates group bacterium GW2011_GWA1_46_7]